MIIIDQKNSGAPTARNNGLRVATGEYVYFIDSDDYIINDNCLNELYNVAKKAFLDILNFNHLILKNNSLKKVSIKRENNKIYTGKEYISTAEKGNITNPPWDKLLKRSYLKEINFYYTSGIIHDDAEALLRLFYNAEKVSFVNKFVYVYRIRANSITNSEKTEKGIISTKKILETYTYYYDLEKDKGVKRFIKSLIFNRLVSYYDLILGKEEFINNAIKIHGYKYYIGSKIKFWLHSGGIFDIGRKTWFSDFCCFEANGGKIKLGFNNFFNSNCKLVSINKITIGDNNLFFNKGLRKISLESAVSIGSNLLYNNEIINEINMPLVETIDDDFIAGLISKN